MSVEEPVRGKKGVGVEIKFVFNLGVKQCFFNLLSFYTGVRSTPEKIWNEWICLV